MVSVHVGGEIIVSTSGHPYWVAAGERLASRPVPEHAPMYDGVSTSSRWVDAGDLQVGDGIVLRDGRQLIIEKLTVEKKTTTVYNMTVNGTHNYYVSSSGVLVHNACKKVHGNSNKSQRPTEHYRIEDANGKPYDGIGDVDGKRAKDSLKRLKKDNPGEDFEIKKRTRYENRADALKAEDKGIWSNGSGGPKGKKADGANYNKINSPGHKLNNP